MKRRTRVVFGPATLLSIFWFLFVAAGSFASDTVAVSLFPAESFRRDPGAPTSVVRTFTVPAVQGTFTLHVTSGDGVVDNVATTDEAIDFTFTAPGTYRGTVTAIDNSGGSFSADRVVVVQDRYTVDDLLSNRWHALSASLQAQDVTGSLVNLLPESRGKYEEVFSVVGPDLPAVFASVSPPELIKVEGDVAQYRVRGSNSGRESSGRSPTTCGS